MKLAPDTLCEVREQVGEWPQRLVVDRAYDSDGFRTVVSFTGGEVICPHRRGRKRPPLQDGRKLRRYKRRWKIERLFAWLFNFRRLVVRYEYHDFNYLGFIQLACAMILLRHL